MWLKFNEIEARLEVSMKCILADIRSDMTSPEDGDFDYENCSSIDELALNLSDMIEAHILDSDDMLEFHQGETSWLGL
jgi:hypothetical protein